LHGIQQSELRVDDAWICLIAAKLDADAAMQLDDILNCQVTGPAISQ
jgi:hypothetical protein